MSEKRIPTFTFSRRLGHTTYSVNVFSKDNEAATYEDKLLELIRSGALQAADARIPYRFFMVHLQHCTTKAGTKTPLHE